MGSGLCPLTSFGIAEYSSSVFRGSKASPKFANHQSLLEMLTQWMMEDCGSSEGMYSAQINRKLLIRCYSSQYSARLSAHPNDLTVNLMELPDNRRLRRHLPNAKFLV
jgi:hypothetical protein